MKREILANALGGVITAIIIFFGGYLVGIFHLDSPTILPVIVVFGCSTFLAGAAIFIVRAKKPAITNPLQTYPRFAPHIRLLAVPIALLVIGLLIWFLVYANPKPFTIPPLVVSLKNSSKVDVTVAARADFELLVDARVNIGTSVARGSLDFVTIDGQQRDFLVVPANSQLLVAGFFRQPQTYRPFLEIGNSDIELRMYKIGGGVIINSNVFPFDRKYLEKYRLDLEVGN